MINWILGAVIIGFTLYVAISNILKLKKGESACSSCSCGTDSCCSKK